MPFAYLASLEEDCMRRFGAVKLVGCLYGFWGFSSLPAIFYLTLGTWQDIGPSRFLGARNLLISLAYVGVPIVVIIFGFCMMWGFFARKRWARYAAIVSNGAFVLIVIGLVVYYRLAASTDVSRLPAAVLFTVVIVLIPLSILAICLTAQVKDTMTT